MVFLDWKELPVALGASAIRSSRSCCWSCWCPGLLAFVFGFFAFRSRIKGVYFSIITQAMTFAAMLLFFRNETGFGGNNGFTDFKRILGIADRDAAACAWCCSCSPGCVLIGFFLLARAASCTASSAACCRRSATPRAA